MSTTVSPSSARRARKKALQRGIRIVIASALLLSLATFATLIVMSLRENGGDPQEYLASAKAYVRNGDDPAARIELKNALKLAPELGEARYLLSQLYIRQGHYEPARKELERAREAGYQQDLWLGYARLYLANKEFELLQQSLPDEPQIAAENQPEFSYLLDLARLSLNQPLLAEAKRLTGDSAHVNLHHALLKLSEGDAEAALAALRLQLEKTPDLYNAWALLATLGAKQADLDLLREGLEGQLRVRPADFASRATLTALIIEANQFEQARPHVKRLLKRAKQHPLFNYYGAVLAFHDKQADQARQHLEITLAAYPQYAPARALASVLAFDRGDYEQSRSHLAGIVDHIGGDHPLQRLMVVLDAKLGEVMDASQRLEKLPPLGEQDIPLMRLMASEMTRHGQLEKGIALLEQAHQLQPQSSDIYALGGLYLVQGNAKRAVEMLEQTSGEGESELNRLKMLFVAHLKQDQRSEAEQVASQVREAYPASAEGHTLIAVLALADQDLAAAREHLLAALGANEHDPAASVLLYRIDIKLGDYTGAKSWLDRSLAANPTHLRLQELLFKHDVNFGLLPQDLPVFEKAHQLAPDALQPRLQLAAALMSVGQLDKAKQLLSGEYAESALAQPLLIRIHLLQNDIDAARATVLRWREVQPESLALLYWEAKVQMLVGEFEQALATNRVLLEKAPELLDAQIDKAFLMLKLERAAEFDIQIARVAEKAPKNTRVLELQAQRAWQKQRAQDALGLVQQLHQIQPSTRSVLLLAGAHERVKQVPQAMALLQDWLSQNPEDAPARVKYAEVLLVDGCSEAVISQYQLILDTSPNNAVALNNQAWCMLQLGQLESAQETAARAYQLFPERPEILDTYGMILLEIGRNKQAMKLLEQASTLSKDPNIRYHVALAMTKNERLREARKILIGLLSDSGEFSEREKAQSLLQSL